MVKLFKNENKKQFAEDIASFLKIKFTSYRYYTRGCYGFITYNTLDKIYFNIKSKNDKKYYYVEIETF